LGIEDELATAEMRCGSVCDEHPAPAEVRWLTSIVADEDFTVQSSAAGPDLWAKKLTRATLVLALPPLLEKPC
jgi:hypothetical protein